MTQLENFIDMHRNEFDVYQPGPEVWAGVSSGVTASAVLPRPAKFPGTSFKNLILAFAVTSATIATGIWAYQSVKPQETVMDPVTRSTAPAEKPAVTGKAPVAENSHEPVTFGEEAPVSSEKPGGSPESDLIPPASSSAEAGDSVYSGIKSLKLNSPGYNFRIRRSDSKMTRVRVLKQAIPEHVLRIEQKGSELVFEHEGGDKGRTTTNGEIEILIPDGEVSRITSASSNIDLDRYNTPALSMETSSGNIRVTGVKAKLDITSTSGNQYFAGITGDIKSSCSSGNITLKDMLGSVTCAVTSGNIELNDVQGKLDLHTNSGNINGEAVNLVESCNLKTITGNIFLGLKNSADELRFELSSTLGFMKIKKGTGEYGQKSLKSGNGKIPVIAETNTGNQVYW